MRYFYLIQNPCKEKKKEKSEFLEMEWSLKLILGKEENGLKLEMLSLKEAEVVLPNLSQDITQEINILKLEIMTTFLMLMMIQEFLKLFLLMMEAIRWTQLKDTADVKD